MGSHGIASLRIILGLILCVVAPARSSGDSLTPGGSLGQGDVVYSQKKNVFLEMQKDCNLVVYSTKGNRAQPIWASEMENHGRNCHLEMHGDGNLVLYVGSGTSTAIWNTATRGYDQAHAVMQNDGNLVVTQHGQRAWLIAGGRTGIESPTEPAGSYQRTCGSISVKRTGDVQELVADCRRISGFLRQGGSRHSVLLNWDYCQGDIANDNGHLRCNRPVNISGGPPGSYAQSCDDVHTINGIVYARCDTGKNSHRYTSIRETPPCGGDLANRDGSLRCERTGADQAGAPSSGMGTDVAFSCPAGWSQERSGFEVTVANSGARASADFRVRVFPDSKAQLGQIIDVPSIPAKGTSRVSFKLITWTPGQHNVVFAIQPPYSGQKVIYFSIDENGGVTTITGRC